MFDLLKLLRSPGLALAVLLFLALYAAFAAWLPAAPPAGGWRAATGLDHPFSSSPFLVACALLFLNTLACTWDRTNRTLSLWRGVVPPSALLLEGGAAGEAEAFLVARGFSPRGAALFRFRWALWGGWLLHAGLLVLMAGVLVQRIFHDSGTFELAERERVNLSAPEAVLHREKGLWAASRPPDVSVALDAFDPYQHQRGYAPDRSSRLTLEAPGRPPVTGTLDRAQGLALGGTTIYQAIPSGIALVLEIPGSGARVLRLRADGERRAFRDVVDPAGRPARFVAQSERPLDDRLGTGALRLWLEQERAAGPIALGAPFDFGGRPAKVVAVTRWAGFTYAVSPGMPAVYAGFILVLGGCLLTVFPAGAARVEKVGGVERVGVHLTRGAEVLGAEWGRIRESEGAPGRSAWRA